MNATVWRLTTQRESQVSKDLLYFLSCKKTKQNKSEGFLLLTENGELFQEIYIKDLLEGSSLEFNIKHNLYIYNKSSLMFVNYPMITQHIN